jgi:hypothetical protein
MKNIGIIALMCAGSLAVILPRAKADAWNQKTIFTFSGPVQIPGQDLPAGTYVFKLVDTSGADRDIVEVLNRKETHVYGTFITIPDYHLKPSGKTILSFDERPAGTPEAVRAWFYPGDNFGHEFVYPRARARELARVNHLAVASMPDGSDVAAMKHVTLKAQKPTGEEVDIQQEFTPPPTSTSRK